MKKISKKKYWSDIRDILTPEGLCPCKLCSGFCMGAEQVEDRHGMGKVIRIFSLCDESEKLDKDDTRTEFYPEKKAIREWNKMMRIETEKIMETKTEYNKRMRTLHKCVGCGKMPKVTRTKDADGNPAIKIDCNCKGHLNKCVTYCDSMATNKEDCIERYNIFLNELKNTAIQIIVTIAEDGRVSLQQDAFKKDYEKRTKDAIPSIIAMFENLHS